MKRVGSSGKEGEKLLGGPRKEAVKTMDLLFPWRRQSIIKSLATKFLLALSLP